MSTKYSSLTSEETQQLRLKLYDDFVEGIDGIDNGISEYSAGAGEPNYKERTDLSSRVGYLNPRWNETVDDDGRLTRFEKASRIAGEEFFDRVDYAVHAWLPARQLVAKALAERKQKSDDSDPSGRLIIFDTSVAWKVRNSTPSKTRRKPLT